MSNFETPLLSINGPASFGADIGGGSRDDFYSKPHPFPITFELTEGDKVVVNNDGEIVSNQ